VLHTLGKAITITTFLVLLTPAFTQFSHIQALTFSLSQSLLICGVFGFLQLDLLGLNGDEGVNAEHEVHPLAQIQGHGDTQEELR